MLRKRPSRARQAAGACGILMNIAIGGAHAHDIKHPEHDGYYRSLTLPGEKQGFCCSGQDCKPVDSNFSNGRWWAYVSKDVFGPTAPDAWLEIPENKIVPQESRPERPMEAVVCWVLDEWTGVGLRCFDPPVNGS